MSFREQNTGSQNANRASTPPRSPTPPQPNFPANNNGKTQNEIEVSTGHLIGILILIVDYSKNILSVPRKVHQVSNAKRTNLIMPPSSESVNCLPLETKIQL